MNKYLQQSIDIANNYDYLDRLYTIYPTTNNIRRNIDKNLCSKLYDSYNNQNNKELIIQALELDLFPIKDSYVAFLKRYPNSIEKNPQTINRLAGKIYQIGWDKFLENITEPIENNRQMGNKFSGWLSKKHLGLKPIPVNEFIKNDDNAILSASDEVAKNFAKERFGYSKNKGLDFIARFNKKYIIGEAKFLTDFGGHQYAGSTEKRSAIPVKDYIALPILKSPFYHQLAVST